MLARPDEPESRPRSNVVGPLLGFVIGVASDVALWVWMTGGALVDGLARAKHGYSEEIDLTDINARGWCGLAFAAAMTFTGAVLTVGRIQGVGVRKVGNAVGGLPSLLGVVALKSHCGSGSGTGFPAQSAEAGRAIILSPNGNACWPE